MSLSSAVCMAPPIWFIIVFVLGVDSLAGSGNLEVCEQDAEVSQLLQVRSLGRVQSHGQFGESNASCSLSVQDVPTTIPSDCAPGTGLPSTWNEGSCALGAKYERWSVDPNGTRLGGDLELCSGALSCESRQEAWRGPHVVVSPPRGDRCQSLVVFLGGTGTSPRDYMRLLRAIAQAGHFVIGLAYLLQPVASSQYNFWCATNPPGSVALATECNKDAHHSLLFKTPAPTKFRGKSRGLWDVPPESSVEALLADVLQQVKWGNKFLNGDKIRWSRVIASGFSQGASHMAYFACVKRTRAVLLSGPQDCAACSAGWLGMCARSAARVKRRVLFHRNEECGPEPRDPTSYCEEDLFLQSFPRMGLRSTASTWSGGPLLHPPGLQVVMSDVEPACATGRKFHNSVATDSCAPVGIEALWTSMFEGM